MTPSRCLLHNKLHEARRIAQEIQPPPALDKQENRGKSIRCSKRRWPSDRRSPDYKMVWQMVHTFDRLEKGPAYSSKKQEHYFTETAPNAAVFYCAARDRVSIDSIPSTPPCGTRVTRQEPSNFNGGPRLFLVLVLLRHFQFSSWDI